MPPPTHTHTHTHTATPIFTQQPEPSEMILKRDEHIILTVEAKCDPGSPKFQWFKGETPLVGEKSNKLVIYNAHRGNSGFYICRATNPFINDEQRASVFSQWVKVEVQEVGETQAQSPIRQGGAGVGMGCEYVGGVMCLSELPCIPTHICVYLSVYMYVWVGGCVGGCVGG